MIAPLAFLGPRQEADLTCYTSPVQHVTYSWPSQMGAWASAFYLFACIFVGVMVVMYWRRFTPCEVCDEFKPNCRCKGRDY